MTSLLASLVLMPAAWPDCGLTPEGRVGELVVAAWQEADAKPADKPKQETAREKRDRERHEQDVKNDVEIGKKYAAEAEKELKPSKDQEAIDRVNKIGEALEKVANDNRVRVTWGDSRHSKFDYQFKVVQNKEVNAFCLPGGYIFVYEGLLKFCESDDELAGVLSHEISHASFRHLATLERESQKFSLATLPAILVAIFAGKGAEIGALASLVGTAKGSGWSQEAELAADFGSFQYMQLSSYNPVGMLTFIERLGRSKAALENIDWGIYRTHPPSRERAEALTGYLAQARIPIRRSQVSSSARATTKANSDATVDVLFDKKQVVRFAGLDAAVRAEEAVLKLNDFFDTVPELFEVSFTAEGMILGRKDVLFRLTPDDAKAAKKSLEALSSDTTKALRRSMSYLAYRIWDIPTGSLPLGIGKR